MKTVERRPTRTCVGCGERDAQAVMLRIKADREGALLLASSQVGGRSAYLHEMEVCLTRLPKSRLLRRSLRADIPRSARQALVDIVLQRSSASGPSRQSMKPEA